VSGNGELQEGDDDPGPAREGGGWMSLGKWTAPGSAEVMK